jgi:NADP-dependent 3-hydroxy acid dehydrogenase YdfG
MILTNVLGVALTIRATLPSLLEADRGHYLITGSVAGRRALAGSLYSSTKWAVTGMAESLRQELRQMHENTSVRVTLIEPGMTDTEFFDNRPDPGRALADEDVAAAALYALSQPERADVNEILIRPSSQPI